MERGQVVQVRGPRFFGSGYLIAPRLVLTAAHVVPPEGVPAEITVSPLDSAVRSSAVVRWHRLDDTVDAALLEIPVDEATWVVPDTLRHHLQRWGRFVTIGTEIRIAAMGFPRQQRQESRTPHGKVIRHAEVVGGRVRPHGGPTFEILDVHSTLAHDTPGPGHEGAAATTAWSGMSGAAVFPEGGNLLLGLVCDDRRPDHGTRLRCTGSQALLACDRFRAVVREATGVDPQPEPAELTGLLEPAPPKRALKSPAMLLRADAEVVPFHSREDTLAALEEWCRADAYGLDVRVLTGPGGQGKTRLARELMARLRGRGWVAGQISRRAHDMGALRAIQCPVLFVVDYAETRPELVRDLQEWADDAAHPVRLLLLARSLGSWQITATGTLHEIRLHALSPGDTDREFAFRTAARGLSHRMAEVTRRTDVDWPALADTLAASRSGAQAQAETALTVQMAALVALLRHGRDLERDTPLEDQLLDHENKYWLDNAAGRDLGKRAARLLGPAVAAAVLCPARDEDEARDSVTRALPREQEWVIEEVADVLRDLYPPSEDRYWGQLEPDRLAEYHAGEQVIGDAGFIGRLFDHAPDHHRVQMLTVLARSAVAHANEERTDKAHAVVDRLRETLRSVPAERPLTATVLRTHTDTLPERSHVLRDYALDVARALSRLSRATDEDGPQALRDHAWALHNLAERHLAIGDWDDARKAAGEAATLRENLAKGEEPGAGEDIPHHAEWAESLLALSYALRATGHRTQAYDTARRTLGLFRAVAKHGQEDREKRERGLVRALINYSQVVWQLDPASLPFDEVARSDPYTEEAVRRARDLADRHPELDPRLLTDALQERSTILWRLGRHPESLTPGEEALRTARRLAEENPDSCTADLVHALLGLAVDYSYTPRPHAESVALGQQAIDLLRPLARDLPEIHRSTLAQLLHNHACSKRDEEDYEAARNSIAEAIEHRRALVRGQQGMEPRLAGSVSVLGGIHARAGNHQAAAERYAEALEIYASATLPLTADELNSRSGTGLDLALSYEALGRARDALAVQNEALAIRLPLSEYAPSLYMEGYAIALHEQSDLYRTHERPVAARVRLRQALPRYRRLSRDDTEARAGLAACLHALGASYLDSPVTAERAVAPLREAYELRVALSAGDAKHEEYLADTCADLGRAWTMTRRFPESVRVAEHEVRLRRHLLDAEGDGGGDGAAAKDAGNAAGRDGNRDGDGDRDRHRNVKKHYLCFALLRLAEARAMAGHTAAAWRTAVEAEKTCREVVDGPRLPPDRTALLLRRLAQVLSLCGRHDLRRAARARQPARRALRICRRLVTREPANSGYRADLRVAVDTLAQVLERLGRHAEAVDVRMRKGA